MANEATISGSMVFGERRLHQRKECTFAIDIDDYRRVYKANLRDLSLGGALIEIPSNFKVRIGKELMLSIPFRNRGGVVTIKGKLAETRNENMVVEIYKRY